LDLDETEAAGAVPPIISPGENEIREVAREEAELELAVGAKTDILLGTELK
jgi:hypothetical protein